MADNYLEKQYEQYAARKAAWEKARKMGKKTSRHQSATIKQGSTTGENAEKEQKR
ncbi:MAG: hypothetical protein IJ417_05225 [Bacteroidaceae bacterium]|nr:hypothetical protein [Bacteroidaceae bacterium]